jgi:polyisoprenoid-binding protein YceI
MKTIRLIPTLTLLIAMLFVVSCSEDEKPLVKLTGKITFTDPTGASANAAGAVVYLATGSVATTTYEQSTIADANGMFTFSNLAPNSYYINSVYQTDNKNKTARLDGLTFTTAEGAVVTVGESDVTQDLALVSIGQSGATFEALAVNYSYSATATAPAGVATPGNYVNTGAWTYDGTHSPIAFEFPYRGQEADFFGAFSQLSKFVVNFDAANLATSTIDVEIDVASINTRNAGGRDPRTTVADNPPFNPTTLFTEYGCIFGTFGIAAATTPTDAVPQTISDTDRYAQFKSTSIVKYGDGYIAKGNVVFHGFTVPVDLMFKQSAVWLDTSNNRKYSGFEGKFTMAAKKDYGITSSSVNDALIKIQISIVVYKQL